MDALDVELEKEAKEWCKKKNLTSSNVGYFTSDYCEQSYLAGAEPREKRIEELEKENAELKECIKSEHEIEARKNNSLISQLTKARICLEQLISEITVGELEVDPNILQQAEQFLNEVEK